MPKKLKSKDLLALVEQAFLQVKFETHYQRFKRESGAEPDSVNLFKIMVADDLISHARKLFKELLDED